MDNIVKWVVENWDNVIQVILQIVGLASVIVKITPTLKDDDFLKTAIKFIGKYVALDKYGPTSGVTK
jgi:hypothetical protein